MLAPEGDVTGRDEPLCAWISTGLRRPFDASSPWGLGGEVPARGVVIVGSPPVAGEEGEGAELVEAAASKGDELRLALCWSVVAFCSADRAAMGRICGRQN